MHPPKNDLGGLWWNSRKVYTRMREFNIVTGNVQYIWSPFSEGPKKGILAPKIWILKGLSP